MTQQQISQILDIPDRTLRDWKKGRNRLYTLLESLDYEESKNRIKAVDINDNIEFDAKEYSYNCFWQTNEISQQKVYAIIFNYLSTMNQLDVVNLCEKYGKSMVKYVLDDKYKKMYAKGYISTSGIDIELLGKYNQNEFEKKVTEKYRLKTKGIEVGHIFYFGDKYSKPLNAAVDFSGGKKDFVKMGSYGIGVSRLVGAIIEAKYDDKEEIMKWPLSVAPYDIALIPMISKNDNSNLEKANNIYKHLNNKNIDSIIDDTDENFSSKMKKFNLIGAPYQILLGKKSDGDLIEFKELGKDPKNLTIEQITKFLTEQKEKI